jgi:acyl-CoA synthetase (AMP-forming)/AMP-acid ligase II
VEAVLRAHDAVADVLVVGRPDPRFGEQVAAVVQPRDRARPPALEELQAHCRDRLAGYKRPRSLHLVDRIERSPSGKPDYRWARELVVST